MNQNIEYPKAPDTPVSHLPFSPVVKVGNLLFVSGQASVDSTGKIISDTFEGEFHRSMKNIEKILHDAGSDMAHIVQTRNYVRDPKDVKEFNALYAKLFSAPYPARTTITNCLPETLRYEVECIAVVKE
ncbi:MAG: RidA family protein [Chthoniobacterales bacterium]